MVALTGCVQASWLAVWFFYFRPKYPSMRAQFESNRRRSIAIGKKEEIEKTPDMLLFMHKGDENTWTDPVEVERKNSKKESLLGGMVRPQETQMSSPKKYDDETIMDKQFSQDS